MPMGAPSTGDVVTLDRGTAGGAPSAVYLGASRRGSNTGDGGIWSSSDPMGDGGWESEHLPVKSDVMALGSVTRPPVASSGRRLRQWAVA